ncbi:Mu-like prophage protein gp36 [Pseudomonas sp. 8Z]|uniref:phage protein Gp36 family protein n=1 Tax=Pseudomonas sp. 8Z TaxID=2653166 RepID=UPI0012F27D29|nr:phage protein Gp36 family protein [Pseudomonas sp. 8Z]VXC71969.1 Mu-like prophage protein gp36 [Pseudomonas sp. 8Z]
MNLSLPSASQMIVRYGAKQLTELAVPRDQYVIDAELLTAAAGGDDMGAWPAEDVAIAVQALARIADAVTRARSEVSFYLRFRKAGVDAPVWVADDLMELARYHLVDDAGKEESTVRARYKDVIKRLETLAEEDESRGASEAGESGLRLSSQPRMFNRNTLSGL